MPANSIPARLLRVPNWCCLILTLVLLGSYFLALKPERDDFFIYYQAARSIRQVGDPYTQAPPYIYPPLLAYLVQPLTLLPRFAAQQVWFILNTALLGALLYLVLRYTAPAVARQHWGLVSLCTILAPPTWLNLQIGQLGILMGLLIVLLYVLRHRTNSVAAVFGVACALKLYPGLFGLLYLRQKSWSLAVKSGIATGAVVVLNIAWSGLFPYLRFVNNPFPKSALPAEAEFNISLYGFWFRLLTDNPYAVPAAHLPLVAMAITAFTCVLAIAICLWVTPMRSTADKPMIFSLWLVLLQLITPINGYYNLLVLLLPALVLLGSLTAQPSKPLTSVLIIATALLWLPPGWTDNLPWLYNALHIGWGQLLLTPALYGVLLYFGMLVVRLRARQTGQDTVWLHQQGTLYASHAPGSAD